MLKEIIIPDEEKLLSYDGQPVAVSPKHRVAIATARQQSGIFITCGKTFPNVMSTHWGSIGTFWNRDVFILPIRKSKFSHRIIGETKCFAVSVPAKDMRNEIIACDRLSGYDVNKFEDLHLHPSRARKIPTYTVGECGLFLECRVIYEADTTDGQIDPLLHDEMYQNGDFHTMYFAEVVDLYEADEEVVFDTYSDV